MKTTTPAEIKPLSSAPSLKNYQIVHVPQSYCKTKASSLHKTSSLYTTSFSQKVSSSHKTASSPKASSSGARSPPTQVLIINAPQSDCKTEASSSPKASSSGARSPPTQVVIMTDRRREPYVPSKMLRAVPARPAASPPPPTVDPVAEALQLIRADMSAQVGALSELAPKRSVTITLKGPVHQATPDAERSGRQPSPPPKPPKLAGGSIFPDDIEDFYLRVRRRGGSGQVTERFGELLKRQTVVRQLQRRLQLQTAEMRADAQLQEETADAERRRRFGEGEERGRSPPPPPVPPTTAAETLMVLRDQGVCGAADLCATPRDLPRAQELVHRLRCEVLELRAVALRTTCEKNEVAAQLNSERAQLLKTFTEAQIDRLTGRKQKPRWGAEDVRRAIAARRVLSRRQYRFLVEVMRVPLPGLKLKDKAIKTSEETKRLYEQLVTEKVLKYKTKRRRVDKPRVYKPPTVSYQPYPTYPTYPTDSTDPTDPPDGLISMASASSDSEDGQLVFA